jgi:hypothetical protein
LAQLATAVATPQRPCRASRASGRGCRITRRSVPSSGNSMTAAWGSARAICRAR